MNKKLVIFGTGKISEVISYFFERKSSYDIYAYTIDSKYKKSDTFNKKPIINFENLLDDCPPEEFDVFVALGYQNLNQLRAKKYNEVKAKGYYCPSYIDHNSNIPDDLIHGENCFLMSNSLVHPKVKIGNNVFVWSGAIIGHHTKIEDNCWFTSGSNISGNVNIGKNSFFAINSTIANSLEIGENCFFVANTLITKCVNNNSVYIEPSSEKFRLDTEQFLKFSKFDQL